MNSLSLADSVSVRLVRGVVARRSQRRAVAHARSKTHQTAPHHLHRGPAGGSGAAVPAEPVPGRPHQGEAGPAGAATRRAGGGVESVVLCTSKKTKLVLINKNSK